MTVQLLCKPYVAVWLKTKYGNPVKFDRGSNVKNLFMGSLDKNYFRSEEYSAAMYSKHVDIALNKEQAAQFGVCVCPQLHAFINSQFETIIKFELVSTVLAALAAGGTVKQGIEAFRQNNKLDEDTLPYDAAETMYYRFLRANKIFPLTDGKQLKRA